MKKFTMSLEPSVVKWVIDSSGMDHDTVAQKTGVDKALVDRWVDTGVMEYSKMCLLADCVKRPEAILFLKSPPDDEELTDYRMAQATGQAGLSPKDRVTIRKARYAQSMAREMMEDGGDSTRPRIRGGVAVGDSAEDIAEWERGRLGARASTEKSGSGSTYRGLRGAIESLNILVFQHPMDVRKVRGLTLTGKTPYAILVNSKDPEAARAFTILHEYGHVLLRNGGICDERSDTAVPNIVSQRTESWCNQFATSFLMPKGEFVAERRRFEESLRDPDKVVEELAKKFRTSRYAAAVRAASLPGTRLRGDYEGLLRLAANSYRPAVRKSKGGPAFVDVRVAQMGRKFIRLVLSSYDKGLINARNAIDCLDMDARHFDGLRARVHADE